MNEIELKFQVPPGQATAVARAVGTASARRVRLQAAYADTADRRLAAAGLALRLRREGRRWVQTLKGRGDGLMARPEHEVPVPGGAA
ncbi:MAG: CYTH domain-containing protein, partial [Betaproteobacteria bacterium]